MTARDGPYYPLSGQDVNCGFAYSYSSFCTNCGSLVVDGWENYHTDFHLQRAAASAPSPPPASDLTDRLATALRESVEPICVLLRHVAALDTDAWDVGRNALTTVERALAEYDAQTP